VSAYRSLNFYNADAAAEHYLGLRWPKAIWRAVLEQAVADATVGPAELGITAEQAMEVRLAAWDWIDDTTNEPRRFVWVCEVLDLDPAAVRAAVRQKFLSLTSGPRA
jgi:hypothetical protein